MLNELLSGLGLGVVLISAGVTVFKYRDALVRYNARQRRGVMGSFLTEGMRGGDRVMFPVLALVLCLAGAALIVLTIGSVVSGH